MRFSILALSACALACAKTPPPPPGPSSAPASAPAASAPATRADLVTLGDGTAGLSDDPVRFHKPIRLAVYPGGIVVADISNQAVRLIQGEKVTTLAGGPDKKGHADGPASSAQLDGPHGVAALPDGSIIVAEASNHTLRKLTRAGDGAWTVTTLAGTPKSPGFADGPAAQAKFFSPHGIIALADGSILVADIGNARLRLLKDGVVSTVAGGEAKGSADGNPGSLNGPMDLALDTDGSVLVADASANRIRRWRAGVGLTTVTTAELQVPHGVAVDAKGTLLIAELGGNRVTAHEGDQSRTILEGLERPAAVLLQGGHLWVADLGHHQVKRLPWP